MSEFILHQIVPHIAQLHKCPTRCWLATESSVCQAVCIHENGCYYACPLNGRPEESNYTAGILMIESESGDSRISWVAELKNHAAEYPTPHICCRLAALLHIRPEQLPNIWQIKPAQGCLCTPLHTHHVISPEDLRKALDVAAAND
ncbi:hypothetical protein [Neisseria weixii]|uniref:hypothetical protein n=1 Tax=Neisseria weixii TaxID=1853276 RepID=UPI00359F7755